MEFKVKVAAALPQGDGNGFDDFELASVLAREGIEGRQGLPRVALIVYRTSAGEVSTKKGATTATVELLRVEPLHSVASRRHAEQMLVDEFAARTGQAMLPYDLLSLSKAAFADLPRTIEEIDESEERERENMSPHDELRRHLERIHGVTDARTLTDTEADEKHRADHDGGRLPAALAHEPAWHGWTRADIEAAAIDSDDLPEVSDGVPSVVFSGDTSEAEGTLFDPEDVAEAETDPR